MSHSSSQQKAHNIVTLTLSPSLDCSSRTQRIFPASKIRCETPVYEPGGGGINVSRVITRLGGRSTPIYPSGGSTGTFLTQLLHDEDISARPVATAHWTRQNLNIATECDNQQYRFIMPGAQLSAEELEEIQDAVLEECSGYLVISGSVPESVPSNYVSNLIKKCKQKDIRVVFDSSGDALRDVVNGAELYLVKPNARELASLTNTSFSQAGDLVHQARDLISSCKIEIVLVSLGAQGALLVTKDICEQIIAPKVTTHSTVGAGDSMLGAVVHGLACGHSPRDVARMGVAAGTAATMREGTQLCRPEDVKQIYQWLLEQHPL